MADEASHNTRAEESAFSLGRWFSCITLMYTLLFYLCTYHRLTPHLVTRDEQRIRRLFDRPRHRTTSAVVGEVLPSRNVPGMYLECTWRDWMRGSGTTAQRPTRTRRGGVTSRTQVLKHRYVMASPRRLVALPLGAPMPAEIGRDLVHLSGRCWRLPRVA